MKQEEIIKFVLKNFEKENKIYTIGGSQRLQKNFLETLDESQKQVYENIITGLKYEQSLRDKAIIEYTLNFVSIILGTNNKNSNNIFFD